MFEYDAANIETFFRKFQIFFLQTSEMMIWRRMRKDGFSTEKIQIHFKTLCSFLSATQKRTKKSHRY
ncbi:MAG: hypothetical protein A2W99_10190 [Bacteroidetes bacterium GWF2_33_16]|nr:MAG: hypothetical protein A2X00_05550 [Bacteroidetes bacterium GWE2_32_14]OFY03917.1 MAG: hypothetical protein A2W99_10190 [Bacteroidetes bacterium GWF2_33_16]